MRLANLSCALAVLTAIVAPARAEAQGVALRYGVASFGEVEPLRDAATIAACGYDYIEPGLSKTLALPELDRQEQLRRHQADRTLCRSGDQLKEFLRTAGGIIEARRYGMVIGIEPLRKPESNIATPLPKPPDLRVR